MTTLITIHVILLVFVLIVFLIGLFLPKRTTVARSATVNALPEEIWRVATDREQQPRWRPGLKKVEIRENGSGRTAWIEYPTSGPAMTFTVREAAAPRRYETELTGAKGMTVRHVLELERIAFDVTKVTVTEYADVKNPFTRVLASLQFSPAAAIDQYLGDLSAEVARRAARLESQTS